MPVPGLVPGVVAGAGTLPADRGAAWPVGDGAAPAGRHVAWIDGLGAVLRAVLDCVRTLLGMGGHAGGGGGGSGGPTPPAVPGDGEPDFSKDRDGDGLPDVVEERFGSHPSLTDTDRDGLTDAEELRAGTDPTRRDTDGNGILDPDDDPDRDGVPTRQELIDGTQAFNADTDGDGLSDGDERSLGTDPLRADTDGDGVPDGDEVRVGSDPLVADADGLLTVEVVREGVPASLLAHGPPAALAATTVEVAPAAAFGDIPGLVGTPVVVDAGEGLTSATLTLTFDAASVPAGADLAVLHFDEEEGRYDRPADQAIDVAAGIATVTTTEFSPFIVVDLNQFDAIWRDEIVVPRDADGTATQLIDAVLSIDGSGSMDWNDPDDLRFDAAASFVDALLPDDRAAVVGFDSGWKVAQSLTTDHAAVKAAISSTYTDGGTSISAAVQGPLEELDANGDPAHARIVVLLTDGDGSYDPSLTARAADSDTTIYTVGLGSSVNERLLEEIATQTGGKYFFVANADGLKDAYERIGGDLGTPDTDGDGISDEAEINGWRTQRGNVYVTDPHNPDTDGDGLTDGEEAGALISTATGYVGVSNPLVVDTDGDGLDDLTEVVEGTSPLDSDTDGDGLDDFDELEFGSDPAARNPDGDSRNDAEERDEDSDPYVYDLTGEEAAAAFTGGLVFGDWEWGAEHIGQLNLTQRESFPYLLGAITSGLAVYGDVRDVISNLFTGDVIAAVASLIGIIPAVGDAGRITAKTVQFASKSPQAAQAALAVAITLAKNPDEQVAAIRRVIATDPAVFRLPQDVAVRGSTPRDPLELDRPISRSAAQNAAKDQIIEELRAARYTEIRVDQRQVNGEKEIVGINRPDIQATALNGKRVYIELDTNTSTRGPGHARRLLANDPDADVYLLQEPYILTLIQ
ncbi:VWA domain-containing protein [Microbacterium sp. No. 7]|uniref:VWA domain-containing protein n=1 Tax=Microbacterium sp. No. 7 TaxID=1714373 RepID=UPI0012E26C6B|nr:VWA domain-containing protein [Microbacterium sp. No. 7]